MIFEIVYATVERGIIKGSSGFCPVAVTESTPQAVIKPLYELAKRQVLEAAELRISNDPEAGLQRHLHDFYSFFPIKVAEKKYNLLCRGVLLSGSPGNEKYLVHQILVPEGQEWTCGPAAVLAKDDIWITQWSAKPQLLKLREIEPQPLSPRICRHWANVTGDEGWAGTPVEAYEGKHPCVLLSDHSLPSKEILNLLVESQSLVRHQHRWHIGLTIRAWQPFGENTTFWQAFDRGTQEAINSMHFDHVQRIDLAGKLNRATGKYAEQARSGNWIPLSKLHSPSAGASLQSFGDGELKLAPLDDDAPTPAPPQQHTKSVSKTNKQRSKATSPKKSPSTSPQAKTTKDQNQQPSGLPGPVQPTPSKRSMSAATLTAWIKLGLAAVSVIGLGLAAYFGQGMLNNATQIAESLGNDKLTLPTTVGNNPSSTEPADSGETIVEDETGNGTDTTSETQGSPVKKPEEPKRGGTPITPDELTGAIEDAAGNLRQIELVPPSDLQPQPLFRFEIPDRPVDFEELLFGRLKMGNQSLALAFDSESPDLIYRVGSGANSLAIVKLKPVEQEEGAATSADNDNASSAVAPDELMEDSKRSIDVLWQWLPAASQDRRLAWQLMAGKLESSVLGTRRSSAEIALAVPEVGSYFRILDSNFVSVPINPHLRDHLASRSIFQNFRWTVTSAGLRSNSQSSTREESKSSSQNEAPRWTVETSKDAIQLNWDQEYVREKIEELMDVDLSEQGDFPQLVEDMLRYHGPFNVVLRPTIAWQDEEPNGIVLSNRIRFGFGAPGQDLGYIYADRNPKLKPDAKIEEVEEQLAEFLAYKLAEFTGIPGTRAQKVILSGGKGCRKAKQKKQQVQLAIAGAYHQAAMMIVKQEIAYEISRSAGSSRDSFTIVAVGLPESQAE